jgi:hypothetical protein
MSIVINVKDAEQLKAAMKQFVDRTIVANNSGAFGVVESTFEEGIVNATLDAAFQYLEQNMAASAASTGASK